MVNRRKMLIGMGSLAAGSAAAIGTGAFTSVSAGRSITVTTADDNDAFLRIRRARENGSATPNASEYVEAEGDGTVSLDFSETDAGGSGLNKDATTVIDNLLRIENQGTQEVIVGYEHPASPAPGNFALYHEDTNLSELGNPTNDGLLNVGIDPDPDALPKLEPGEVLNNVGVFFFGDVDVSAINSDPVTFLAGDDPEDIGL